MFDKTRIDEIEKILQIRHLYTHQNGIVDDRFRKAFPLTKVNDEYRMTFDEFSRFEVRGLNTLKHRPIPTVSVSSGVTLKNKKRAIILRLSESVVDRLDAVTSELRLPARTSYLRRSLEQALEFGEKNEGPFPNDPALRRALSR